MLRAICAVSAAVCIVAPAASADSLPNVSGTWNSVYHCKVGWCAGQDFPATAVFKQAPGSDTVFVGPFPVKLVGRTFTLHGSQGSYLYTEVITFSADGNSYTGTLTDSNHTSGTDTAVKAGATPPATTTAPTTTAPTTTTATTPSGPGLSGDWSVVSHCAIGWCKGQDFPDTETLTQSGSQLTGTYPQGTITGTVAGGKGTLTSTQAGYSSTFVFTVSADGNTLNGTWTDSHNVGGTAVEKRVSAAPPTTTTTPTTTTPTTTAPTTTTTPTIAGPYPAIVNGSFSAGGTAFTSAYTAATSLGAPGTYAAQTDPHSLNPLWPSFGDHTSGSGQMLVVNGSTTPNQVVWSEVVDVKPNTTYQLSAWVATLYPAPAVLQYSVNGATVGTSPGPAKTGKWSNVSYTWQSGAATTATLAIVDQSVTFGGNDFALDDISFAAGSSAAGGAAHRNPRLSTLASSITSPANAFSSTRASLENAAVAAVTVLFITFPSQLFNHTFEENYADIRDWWLRRLGPLTRLRAKRRDGKLFKFRNTIAAVVVILAGGILGGLLDPRFGWSGSSAVTYASVVCSTVFGLTLSTLVGYEYRKRRGKETSFHLHAIPAGLAIAAICVLTSRLTGFEPGYLYGLICGAAFGGAALAKNEQGHTTTLSVLATITVSLLAWAVWTPLNHIATHPHEAWPVVLGDDFVGALFTGGIVGSTIGLFPLRFLPGGTIAAWHRGAWALTFGFVVFLFLEVILNPGKGGHSGGASLTTAIGLFVLFGGGSVYFYSHFARKKKRLAAEAAAHPEPAEPPVAAAPTEPEPPTEPAPQQPAEPDPAPEQP